MKLRSKKIAKFIPLLAAIVILLSSSILLTINRNKETVIPFSSLEDILQKQNGKPVDLKEQSDGTIHVKTKDGVYVTHIPPGSQMAAKLVETYNVHYSYSNSTQYGMWLLGGIVVVLAVAALFIHKKQKAELE